MMSTTHSYSTSGGGQEALWVEEAQSQARNWYFPRRKKAEASPSHHPQALNVVILNDTVRIMAARKLLAQGDAHVAFHQALAARKAVEGTLTRELDHILQDAVAKGKQAMAKGETERANDLLEFILPPAMVLSKNEVDTVSSLGFDKSFDEEHRPAPLQSEHLDEVLSMSSLNEILDGPITPPAEESLPPKQRFPFRFRSKTADVSPLDVDTRHEEGTKRRFISTIVICEGTEHSHEPSLELSHMELLEEQSEDGELEVPKEDGLDKAEEEDSLGKEEADLSEEPTVEKSQHDSLEEELMPDEKERVDEDEEELQHEESSESPEPSESEDESCIDARDGSDSHIETVVRECSKETDSALKRLSPLKRLLSRRKPLVLPREQLNVTLLESPIHGNDHLLQQPVSPASDLEEESDDRYAIQEKAVDVPSSPATTTLSGDKYSIPTDPCSYCDGVWHKTPTTVLTADEEGCDFKEQEDVNDHSTDENEVSTTATDDEDEDGASPIVQRSKKRFAMFRRKVTVAAPPQERTSNTARPLRGILKSSSSMAQHVEIVPEMDEDDSGDPLLDRLRRRGLEPSEPQATRLDP